MKAPRFFFFDGLGVAALRGYVSSSSARCSAVNWTGHRRARPASGAVRCVVVGGLVALYIGYKYLSAATVVETIAHGAHHRGRTASKIGDRRKRPIILDLRSGAEVEREPSPDSRRPAHDDGRIEIAAAGNSRATATSFSIAPARTKSAAREWRCCCSEMASRAFGPLLGGIDAWRERNYPTELRASASRILPSRF